MSIKNAEESFYTFEATVGYSEQEARLVKLLRALVDEMNNIICELERLASKLDAI